MLRTIAIAGLGLSLACTAADAGPQPDSEGERIYRARVDDGNTFTCATCHAIEEPSSDGLRRPGHPLHDAAARGSWKNGQLSDLREAVGSCLVEWMNAEPWSDDDERWIALSEFLHDLAPGDAPPLRFDIVPPTPDLFGGDAQAGREVFNGSCAVCHGSDGTGTELAPPVAGLGLLPDYVARRVRTSGRLESDVYDGLTGGVMPFWSADRLDDDELRDIVAWLAMSDDPPGTDDAADTGGGSDDGSDPTADDGSPPGGSCDATHARVGQTAVLAEYFHDVGGIAEIVDDCTIVVREFTFDGNGIDVRFYGGLGGDFDGGFAIGEDLVRAGGWSSETVTLTLPGGYTLDDLDSLSVWCVDVGVDFGSGFFE